MNYKDDMNSITLRKCDIHGVLVMLTMNNKETIKCAWESLELMRENVEK